MKFNPRLKQSVMKYIDYVIIVEGKKDVIALENLGFSKVYAVHETGTSLRERAEIIASKIAKKEKICILTDFDKKGKQLYMKLKSIFQEIGVSLDSSLRGLLIKARISHIEGLDSFMDKIDKI